MAFFNRYVSSAVLAVLTPFALGYSVYRLGIDPIRDPKKAACIAELNSLQSDFRALRSEADNISGLAGMDAGAVNYDKKHYRGLNRRFDASKKEYELIDRMISELKRSVRKSE